MEILLVQTAFLGDLLLSIPLIRGIYRCFPDARVTLVCRQGMSKLLSPLDVVDEIHEVKKGDPDSYKSLKSILKQKRWDYVFCPHESFRSALLVGSLKAKVKVGYKKRWNAFFFNERVKRDMRWPDALRQLALLNPVCEKQRIQFESFLNEDSAWNPRENKQPVDFRNLQVPEWASMKVNLPKGAKLGFEIKENAAFIFPGSVWPTKRWTEEGFSGVAQDLIKDGFRVYWMGSPDEASLCERLMSQVPGSESLAGKISLYESFLALAHGKVLISNDSGSMHLGAMAGVPTVAIFGPTVLSIGYRPWQNQAIVVQRDLDCRPCGLHGHVKCPLGHHHCMKHISAEEVSLHRKTLLR